MKHKYFSFFQLFKISVIFFIAIILIPSCKSPREEVEASRVTEDDGFKVTKFYMYKFESCNSTATKYADEIGDQHPDPSPTPYIYEEGLFGVGVKARAYSTGELRIFIKEKNGKAEIDVEGYKVFTDKIIISKLKDNSETMDIDTFQSIKKDFETNAKQAKEIYFKWWGKNSKDRYGKIIRAGTGDGKDHFQISVIGKQYLLDELRLKLKGLN